MTLFWIVGALLVAIALLFIVPPLLRSKASGRLSRGAVNVAVYRDQLRELEADLRAGTLSGDHYEKARRELEARLLDDVGGVERAAGRPQWGRRAALVLGLAVPLAAVGLYFVVGNPQALAPQAATDAAHNLDVQQFQALVDRLAERLKNNPDEVQGWVMLARSYAALGRFGEAAAAYAHAVERLPGDAQVLADYADALAMAQGRRLQGEPEKIIARALQVDPDNVKALALAGTVAFDKQDYATAVAHWERILRLVPQDSELAQSVRASVAEAQALGGGSPAPRERITAAGNNAISGVVRLAPEFAAKVAPTDTVFIFARAADGPRMPLAIMRKQARELPATFTLDDSMAMTPDTKLSNFPRVVVGARISKAANATPQPGDLQGVSSPVTGAATGITVVIDSEIR
ncbi:MAG: c-type cytochrome biogenesis protein CcmI [Betaproteobacteria bacterium RIFCSPLOWO2_12_FULL_62_58]|nr:MAG: c-type cytochrome biogenesis protein CcmI [Betaproteobacteria bacterium RIFCSPLOWO2_12_FULL_62_58]